jgi:hypothetical protein
MKRSSALLAAIATCGAAALLTSWDRPPAVAAPPATGPTGLPVTLADVRARGMTGDLGVAMGKVVPVRGTIVDGRTLRFKDAEGRTYADVDQVDGRALTPAVRIEIRPHRFANPPFAPPAAGTVVNIAGYETGEYTGIVAGCKSPGADTSYFFRNYFVVVR